MRRQEKYPDTKTFHFFNANPKGRYTTDCVIRAISTAADIPYKTVVMEMAEMQCETGYDMSENKLIDMYLSSKGYVKYKQPRKWDGRKYTGAEFCSVIRHKEFVDGIVLANKIIANIGGHHICAIMDGKVWDTWNSTGGCIGNYWVKEDAA